MKTTIEFNKQIYYRNKSKNKQKKNLSDDIKQQRKDQNRLEENKSVRICDKLKNIDQKN